MVAVLNGSLIFAADPVAAHPIAAQARLPQAVSSYHGGTESTGVVTFDQQFNPDVKDRHVLVIDDILDSGRTLPRDLPPHPGRTSSSKSVRVCVLLSKSGARALE